MWWKSPPAQLHRVENRVSTLYVERCHVDRDENAVVLVNRERTVRVPAALVGAVLLGPGTRVTHQAMVLLADSGTSVCWVGEHGVRMYACGLGVSRSSELLQRQAALVTRPHDRIRVARAMYAMRFPGEDVSAATMQQLRGREGARVKKLYREHAERTGVAWSGRKYKAGDGGAASDEVNRVLSAANAALYGACHAAIVGLGISPGLGFVHTGSAVSFVLDVADLYKAQYSIPLAFDLAASGHTDEADARYALRDRFAADRFMPRVVGDILNLLGVDETIDADKTALWDDAHDTPVPGGINWDREWENAQQYLIVSGPTIDAPPPF